MELDKAREFIKNNFRAVMLTYRKDGSPSMSLVNVGLNRQGQAVVSTRETAWKTRNLRRDSRCSICLFTENFYGDWIQIDGTAEVVSLPEAMDLLVDYYRSTYGEHPDWDDYREAMLREKRVMLNITIERAGPDLRG